MIVGIASPAAAVETCGGETATIVGTEGADTLNGTSGVDVIAGLGGNDTINGLGGNDLICGGLGNDTLRDNSGVDGVFGGDGNDTLAAPGPLDGDDTYNGGAGTDVVTYVGRTGAVNISLNGINDDGALGENDSIQATENLVGGSGNDIITGGGGVNVLSGGGGNDQIRDHLGADTVLGGAGADVFIQQPSADAGDVFNGGTGVDEVSYAARVGAVSVTLAGGVNNEGAVGEGDGVINVENATGGSGKDTLAGTGGANVLKGGAGNDTVQDLGGADDVQGGAGNDLFLQGVGADAGDRFDGGDGVDTMSYAARNVPTRILLFDGLDDNGTPDENDDAFGMEIAIGGANDDVIGGNASDNVLRGGAGNDSLNGNDGSDVLFGEAGDDSLLTFDGVSGNDTANGGPGNDAFNIDPGDIVDSIP